MLMFQMMSLRGLLRFQPQMRMSVLPFVQSGTSLVTVPHRQFNSSQLLLATKNEEKHRRSIEKMTAKEETHLEAVNIDTLRAMNVEEEELTEDIVRETFSMFPDETTSDQLFNGIPFKDLPVVLMLLHKNNTRLFASYSDGKYIWHNTPAYHGFLNAKKRTNVAGQVAGLNMGQRLRGLGIRTIRVKLNGFNAARVSALKVMFSTGEERLDICVAGNCPGWD